jgi:hypothetical protein
MGGDALLVRSPQHNDFVGFSASAREGVHCQCLQTPVSWQMPTRLAFTKTVVQQMWQEATTVMAHTAIFEQGTRGGDGRAGGSAVRSPTRAAAKAAFLNKINSLIFNPIEWLDLSEQRPLLSQKKRSANLGAMGQAGAAATSTFVITYASSPWSQGLVWPASRPMHFV